MAALERLAAFVATHRPDGRTRDAVRLHVADTVGAWIAAMGTPEGQALLRYLQVDVQLANLMAVNCGLARLSEVDDIHLGAMITPGAIVIPAALTMGALMTRRDNEELAAAIVAGYEAMIRFGAAIDGPAVLYRGIWPSYFAAPIGTAAVFARLAKLDVARTAHALATALIMAAPGAGHHAASTTARWLAVGHSAARGLHAAVAAEKGFTSDVTIADGDFLKNIFGLAPDLAVLSNGLGDVALHQVSFKPWCAARQTMAATQALKEILAEGVVARDIVSVDAAVLPQHRRMIDHGVTAGDRFSHLTSVQYRMAVAALVPDTSWELGEPAGGFAPGISAFMDRVEVRADDSLKAAGYPHAWAAQVTVETASSRHSRTVTHVPGDPALPFGEADLKEKFRRVTAPVLDANRADAMFTTGLQALDQPGALMLAIDQIASARRA
jgi:2-methylcitrate dehydratase PrpD